MKCDVKTLAQCSEQESKYVSGKKQLTHVELEAEVKRLNGIGAKKMGDTQLNWLRKRLTLLQRLQQVKKEEL